MKDSRKEYLNITLSPEMKAWVKEQARKNYRTASLEVESRLVESRKQEDGQNATA